MRPVKELETLRARKAWSNLTLAPARPNGSTASWAILASSRWRSTPAMRSAWGKSPSVARPQEETLLYYDAQAKQLVFDATRSGRWGGDANAPRWRSRTASR